MDIVQERLEREYQLELVSSAPTVVYEVLQTDGTVLPVDNPAKLPPTGQDRRDPRADHHRQHSGAAGVCRRGAEAV